MTINSHRIMVAPNGARKTKIDHPNLPMTILETVEVARECFAAGAGAIHAHVRDFDGSHVLDAGMYRELIAELNTSVPEMQVQITTEAVGIYTPEQQRQLVFDVLPSFVSVALREMIPNENEMLKSKGFYARALDEGIEIQHILYGPEDLLQLIRYMENGVIPEETNNLLLVLGRYAKDMESDPNDLDGFLCELKRIDVNSSFVWSVCAFGKNETRCLQKALQLGGNVRVGFENSLWNHDGSLANSNAERVAEIAAL